MGSFNSYCLEHWFKGQQVCSSEASTQDSPRQKGNSIGKEFEFQAEDTKKVAFKSAFPKKAIPKVVPKKTVVPLGIYLTSYVIVPLNIAEEPDLLVLPSGEPIGSGPCVAEIERRR
ncbi:17579_t:CDS:2 [Acaulospora colombiana]|uniref:17579_t:CDS:1 n=1 Tax=Acaulospora colombiana TaxID=27376 RepID=A0ACA9MAC8_9GLOM|nr:17579_t:CDS:2 [Acaulospora colombiana]